MNNEHIEKRIKLTDIHKSKQIERIYQQKEYDSKKILNRSEKKIPKNMLETIEKGVTSEQLDAFKVPVFKYGTQITIHGIFPDLEHNLRIGGYKRIFQNKNKSIGVKYEAIDFDKKKRIYRAFEHVHGFRTYQDSKDFKCYIRIPVKDREEALKKIEDLKPLYDKINLQFGDKDLYYAMVPFMGHIFHYAILEICIYAIYEKDISKLYRQVFGKTEKEIVAEIKAKEDKEKAEREALWAQRREEKELNDIQEKKLLDSEIARLSSLGVKFSDTIPITDGLEVIKIKTYTDYFTKQPGLVYHIFHYYKPSRARYYSVHDTSFKTYDEAVSHLGEKVQYLSDDKYKKETTSGIVLSQ